MNFPGKCAHFLFTANVSFCVVNIKDLRAVNHQAPGNLNIRVLNSVLS